MHATRYNAAEDRFDGAYTSKQKCLFTTQESADGKSELYETIINLLTTKLELRISTSDINFYPRVGRKNTSQNNPRPVVVCLYQQCCCGWTVRGKFMCLIRGRKLVRID